jgi:hypothetical protein
MRYLSSPPFVVGLLLVVGAFVALPLSVTELTEETCTTASPSNPSWACEHLMVVDFRIPMLMAASGVALTMFALVRIRRANRRDRR